MIGAGLDVVLLVDLGVDHARRLQVDDQGDGAGLDVVLLVDLSVGHARLLPEVEPVRGLGGLGGTSHYGGPRDLGGLGVGGNDGASHMVVLVIIIVVHAGLLQTQFGSISSF